MKGRGAIIVVLVAVTLTTTAGLASAGEDSGTHVVTMFDPFHVDMHLTGGDPLKVSWNIKVTDGVPMNVALLDDENYELFSQGLAYEAYEGHLYTYVNSSAERVTVAETGTYHVAVETTHSSMDTTTIEYTVKWGEGASDDGSPWCWPAALILALMAGIIAALFGLRRGSGGGTDMTASTEQPPVVETPGMTELGPQPGPPDTPTDGGSGAPAPGTGVYHGPGDGTTQLGPQPEPPDMPPADAWEHPVPDPLSPDARTLPVSEMPHPSPSITTEGTTPTSPEPEPAEAKMVYRSPPPTE